MARACKVIGAGVVVLGLVIAIASATAMMRDDDYKKKELIASRNPGNVMYEAEFGGAKIRRGFQMVFLCGGVLLGLNGITLVLLGSMAARVGVKPPG